MKNFAIFIGKVQKFQFLIKFCDSKKLVSLAFDDIIYND